MQILSVAYSGDYQKGNDSKMQYTTNSNTHRVLMSEANGRCKSHFKDVYESSARVDLELRGGHK